MRPLRRRADQAKAATSTATIVIEVSEIAAPDGQLLPQVQQSFNWVRLAQRIPVHIELETIPDDILLAAGMTATVRLHEQD
mgnify:CR=1 FL=1